MNRRKFLNSAATAGLATGAAAAAPPPSKNAILELMYFRMRNGNQVQRTSDFLGKSLMPALERAGAGPMGFFGAVIGEQSPFALAVISFPSLAAIGEAREKMGSDREFEKA